MRPYNRYMRVFLIVLFTVFGTLIFLHPAALTVLIAAPVNAFLGRLFGAILIATALSLVANESFARLFNFAVTITSLFAATGEAIAALVFMGVIAWHLIAWPLLVLAVIAFLLSVLG